MEACKYFIAVDQGSSGTMSALFNQNLEMCGCVDIPVSVSTPQYGWVEHDPWELLDSVRAGVQKLVEEMPECLEGLEGMGLANQGESFLLFRADTGMPVTPVISWQDSRSQDYCSQLRRDGYDGWFHRKTGLHLSSEWPALKIHEMRRLDPELDQLCRSGQIAFGQLDAWFLYILSNGKVMASDHGTACRTGFYNLGQQNWDQGLLKFFQGEDLVMPLLIDNICRIGGLDLGIGKKIPWLAGGLDQSVTLIGQRCTKPGMAKVTYGTCCACWMNLGKEILLDEKLTTSMAWKLGDTPTYALAAEGGAAGSIITWLLGNFERNWPLEQLSEIAQAYDDQKSLIFVPAFNGLSAPYWEEAKGTLFGMTTGTRPEHILRAGLDAITFTVRDILSSLPEPKILVIDGGMTANQYLIQRQADVLGRPVVKSKVKEGTLMGVAYLCALELGYLHELLSFEEDEKDMDVLLPAAPEADLDYQLWKQSVETVITYYKEGNRKE